MYEILNELSPGIMQDIFETKNNYCNTRNALAFSSRNIETVIYGLQTISYKWLQNFGTLYLKDERSYYSKWI